jgi:transposase InsO family protein
MGRGIRDRPTAPASPWQNGYAERLIGSIRRECLDHVIVWGETHLRVELTTSERIGRSTKMRQSHVLFSEPESSRHARFSVDFTTTTSAFKGSRHTQGPMMKSVIF